MGDQSAKKTDGKRKSKLNLPPEIDDANDAGTKHSSKCTLIVTEGLSAKTLAVAGVSELEGSKNRFGIFPLKGKLLNVRDAPKSQIIKNTEITNLKQVLGLKHKVKYNDKVRIRSLRYGKVMIMTDQDYDGSHIKGLMINLFHAEWPELIQQKMFGPNGNESFMEQFITPIVVASKGNTKHSFYTVPEYEKWKKANNEGKGWKVKYYKGLGSWQRKDGKEHFKQLAKHQIEFKYTNNEDMDITNGQTLGNENDNAIEKAFSKDKADMRKEWISGYEAGTYLDFEAMGRNNRKKRVSYKDFIDKELILFSVNDLRRSVPSICDGLKPGQRKILYCCFLKNNLKKEIRVAQLGGYVSEKSAYHHGEMSLYGTIIGMAQNFVGSNNINLLAPVGMFGSRIKGGKDAASPRYIYTKLSTMTRQLFVSKDDMILDYQEDDGYPVEPTWYMPIIPLILINGCKGIGTGWSTSIPNYNPADIIKNIRRKLNGETILKMKPFYRGFKGQIICSSESTDVYDTYKTYGTAEIINTFNGEGGAQYSTIQISELPICQWTEQYKKYLMDLEEAEQIENVNNMSSDIDVAFSFDVMHKIKPAKKGRGKSNNNNNGGNAESNSSSTSPQRGNAKKFKKKIYFGGTLDDVFLKDMKLISSISCTNMVLFDSNGQIKKYENVEQILQEFYDNRLRAYSSRKKALLASMEHTLKKMTNQARFILMIVDGKLKISKRKRMDVVKDLKRHKFDIWSAAKDSSNTLRNRAKATDAFEEEDDDESKEQQQSNHNNKNEMDVDEDGDSDDLKKYSIGYKYLLSMSLSSLTMERVNELMKRQDDTLKEVNALKQKTVKDLWRDDLDDLDNYLEEYDNAYEENIKLQRKDAEKKRKMMKSKVSGKTKRGKTKKSTKGKVTKGKTKTLKKESSSTSVSSKESSISKGMKNLFKKKTNSKRKKKLLSTTNAMPSDPFSIAKSASNKKSKFVDSEDDDSESPTAGLSLFERARIKRNSPQKTSANSRKRKREYVESENYSDSESGLEEMEPPRKKNKSSSLSTSASSVTLKSISMNKKKKKSQSIMDESDEDFSDESEEYKPPKQARKKVLNYNNKSDEDFDIDEEDDDDDDDESNFNENRRVLKRKGIKRKSYKEKSASTAYTNEDGESDYNLSEDLEINEVDDSDY